MITPCIPTVTEAEKLVHNQDKNTRVPISQLTPDIAFHLVDSCYTSKECSDKLKEFYYPDSIEDVEDLVQDFWGLTVEDDIDIDDFVQKLSEIRGKISLINRELTPSDKCMKKRILSHFIKCCGGFFMSTVISLKDPTVTLQSAITSIRDSQAVYRELHPTPYIAFLNSNKTEKSSHEPSYAGPKRCAHCNRKGHVRESCFVWLETPDGTKWAAKNPKKAAKTLKLKEKLSRKKSTAKRPLPMILPILAKI